MAFKTFDQVIDFSRTSAGTYVNSSGQIVSTPVSKNLLTYTQELDNSSWTKLNSNILRIEPANATLGPELITNGTFDSGITGWTPVIGVLTYQSNALKIAHDSGGLNSGRAIWATPISKSLAHYRVTGRVVGLEGDATGVYVRFGDSNGNGPLTSHPTSPQTASKTGTGTFDFIMPVNITSNNPLGYFTVFCLGGTFAGGAAVIVDDISVKEYIGGDILAPDGTYTADKIVGSPGATEKSVYKSFTPTGVSVFSFYAKAAEYYLCRAIDMGFYSYYATFNLLTGEITNTGGPSFLSASVEPLDNGWYRCSIVNKRAASQAPGFAGFPASINPTNIPPSYDGDGVSGIYGWGTQFEEVSTNSLTIGSELATNGGFDSSSNWGLDTGWSISGGVASFTNPGSGNRNVYGVTLNQVVINKTYKIEFDIVSGTGFRPYVGFYGATTTTTGRQTYIMTATASGPFLINGSPVVGSGSIDNISIKEITGTSVTTSTSYTRNGVGTYPARLDYDPVTLAPKGILSEEQRTNLLSYSERFDSGVVYWSRSDALPYTFDPVTTTPGSELSSVSVPFTVFRDAVTNTASPTLLNVVAGTKYKLEVNVSTNTSTVPCGLRISGSGANISPGQGIQVGQTGTIIFYFTAITSGTLTINGDAAGANLTITSVSVKELTGGTIAASPDGTINTAVKLAATTTSSIAHVIIVPNLTPFALSAPATLSFYAKPGEYNYAMASIIRGANSNGGGAIFDLVNLTSSSFAVSGTTTITTSISIAHNGWRRCTITAICSADQLDYVIISMSPTANPAIDSSKRVAAFTGDGTSGIYIYGAQLEAGTFATSYIPTAGSQVTRSADVANIAGPNFSRIYNSTEGTIIVEADSFINQTVLTVYSPFSINDNTAANQHRVYMYNSKWGGSSRVNSTDQSDLQVAGSYTPNTPVKMGYTYKLNDFAFSVNGSAVLTDTSGTIPTVFQASFGGNSINNPINGHIRSIKYYPVRIQPNAQLQALTV